MPGVLSARWAGVAKDDDANNRLLLEQLADVPGGSTHRGVPSARSRSACPAAARPSCSARWPDGDPRATRGAAASATTLVFVPDGETRTTAEMPADEKDRISHRGKSLRAVAPLVAAALAT